MNLDLFVVRLLILAVPGITGYKIFTNMLSSGKSRKMIKDWDDFSYIILLSVFSYILLAVFFQIIDPFITSNRISITSLQAIFNEDIDVSYWEIAGASIASVFIGACMAWITNKKYIYQVARKFGITNRFGDEDVWSYIMNSKDIKWVLVRDHKLNLNYYGYIKLFSDSGEKREIFLEDVDVYDNAKAEQLYSTAQLYICRDDQDLSVEIPNFNKQS